MPKHLVTKIIMKQIAIAGILEPYKFRKVLGFQVLHGTVSWLFAAMPIPKAFRVQILMYKGLFHCAVFLHIVPLPKDGRTYRTFNFYSTILSFTHP